MHLRTLSSLLLLFACIGRACPTELPPYKREKLRLATTPRPSKRKRKKTHIKQYLPAVAICSLVGVVAAVFWEVAPSSRIKEKETRPSPPDAPFEEAEKKERSGGKRKGYKTTDYFSWNKWLPLPANKGYAYVNKESQYNQPGGNAACAVIATEFVKKSFSGGDFATLCEGISDAIKKGAEAHKKWTDKIVKRGDRSANENMAADINDYISDEKEVEFDPNATLGSISSVDGVALFFPSEIRIERDLEDALKKLNKKVNTQGMIMVGPEAWAFVVRDKKMLLFDSHNKPLFIDSEDDWINTAFAIQYNEIKDIASFIWGSTAEGTLAVNFFELVQRQRPAIDLPTAP